MRASAAPVGFERGLSLNLLSVILNAAAMTISKFALKNVNPVVTTLIICATSTILSFVYMRFRKHTLDMPEFKRLVPIAVINAAATLLLYASIAILDPVIVGMLGRFYVVFTTLLAVIILKEKLTRPEVIFILIAVAGTFLFVQFGDRPLAIHYVGIAMALAYTFLFALANLFVKKNVQNASSVTILFYNNLVAVFACVILLMLQHTPLKLLANVDAATWIFAILTSIITFSGLVLFFNSFRFLSFKLSNILRSTSPIFVAIVSWPFFPIKLSIANTTGAAMVLASVVMLSLIEKKRK